MRLMLGMLVVLVMAAGPVRAGDLILTGYVENDGGLLKRNSPDDKHYTNGFGFSLAHQPDWAGELATEWIPFGDDYEADDAWAGYMIAQQMFTPQDITRPELVRDDRPYAGYLFGSVFVQRANDFTVDHFQLDIGVVGPSSQGGALQQLVHEIGGVTEPEGWDNQLDDEVTVQFHLRKKWRIDLLPEDGEDASTFGVQLIPQAGVALGTVHRFAEGGATLRAGFNLPNDFGLGRLEDVAAIGPGDRRIAQGLSGYTFVRAAGRIVEHNLFLEGNSYEDSHDVEAKALVGLWQWGVAAQYHHENLAVEVSYGQTFFSEEFEGQGSGDAFAALTIGVRVVW